MADNSPESPQRWTTKRRASLILSILKGETAAAQHGLTVAEVEKWRGQFLLGAENALRVRPKDEDALKDEQSRSLSRRSWSCPGSVDGSPLSLTLVRASRFS